MATRLTDDPTEGSVDLPGWTVIEEDEPAAEPEVDLTGWTVIEEDEPPPQVDLTGWTVVEEEEPEVLVPGAAFAPEAPSGLDMMGLPNIDVPAPVSPELQDLIDLLDQKDKRQFATDEKVRATIRGWIEEGRVSESSPGSYVLQDGTPISEESLRDTATEIVGKLYDQEWQGVRARVGSFPDKMERARELFSFTKELDPYLAEQVYAEHPYFKAIDRERVDPQSPGAMSSAFNLFDTLWFPARKQKLDIQNEATRNRVASGAIPIPEDVRSAYLEARVDEGSLVKRDGQYFRAPSGLLERVATELLPEGAGINEGVASWKEPLSEEQIRADIAQRAFEGGLLGLGQSGDVIAETIKEKGAGVLSTPPFGAFVERDFKGIPTSEVRDKLGMKSFFSHLPTTRRDATDAGYLEDLANVASQGAGAGAAAGQGTRTPGQQAASAAKVAAAVELLPRLLKGVADLPAEYGAPLIPGAGAGLAKWIRDISEGGVEDAAQALAELGMDIEGYEPTGDPDAYPWAEPVVDLAQSLWADPLFGVRFPLPAFARRALGIEEAGKELPRFVKGLPFEATREEAAAWGKMVGARLQEAARKAGGDPAGLSAKAQAQARRKATRDFVDARLALREGGDELADIRYAPNSDGELVVEAVGRNQQLRDASLVALPVTAHDDVGAALLQMTPDELGAYMRDLASIPGDNRSLSSRVTDNIVETVGALQSSGKAGARAAGNFLETLGNLPLSEFVGTAHFGITPLTGVSAGRMRDAMTAMRKALADRAVSEQRVASLARRIVKEEAPEGLSKMSPEDMAAIGHATEAASDIILSDEMLQQSDELARFMSGLDALEEQLVSGKLSAFTENPAVQEDLLRYAERRWADRGSGVAAGPNTADLIGKEGRYFYPLSGGQPDISLSPVYPIKIGDETRYVTSVDQGGGVGKVWHEFIDGSVVDPIWERLPWAHTRKELVAKLKEAGPRAKAPEDLVDTTTDGLVSELERVFYLAGRAENLPEIRKLREELVSRLRQKESAEKALGDLVRQQQAKMPSPKASPRRIAERRAARKAFDAEQAGLRSSIALATAKARDAKNSLEGLQKNILAQAKERADSRAAAFITAQAEEAGQLAVAESAATIAARIESQLGTSPKTVAALSRVAGKQPREVLNAAIGAMDENLQLELQFADLIGAYEPGLGEMVQAAKAMSPGDQFIIADYVKRVRRGGTGPSYKGLPPEQEHLKPLIDFYRRFYSRMLEEVQKLGYLEDFDVYEFLDRMDVASYIHHTLSKAGLAQAGRVGAAARRAVKLSGGDPARVGPLAVRGISGFMRETEDLSKWHLAESLVKQKGLAGDYAGRGLSGAQFEKMDEVPEDLVREVLSELPVELRVWESNPGDGALRYVQSLGKQVAQQNLYDDLRGVRDAYFPEAAQYEAAAAQIASKGSFVTNSGDKVTSLSQLDSIVRMDMAGKYGVEFDRLTGADALPLISNTVRSGDKAALDAAGVLARNGLSPRQVHDEILSKFGVDLSPAELSFVAKSHIYLPRPMVKFFTSQTKPTLRAAWSGTKAGTALDVYDNLLASTKGWLTLTNPSFYGRNYLGGTVQNSMVHGLDSLNPITMEKAVVIQNADNMDTPLEIGGETKTVREWYRLAEDNGVFADRAAIADMESLSRGERLPGMSEPLPKQARDRIAETLKAMKKDGHAPYPTFDEFIKAAFDYAQDLPSGAQKTRAAISEFGKSLDEGLGVAIEEAVAAARAKGTAVADELAAIRSGQLRSDTGRALTLAGAGGAIGTVAGSIGGNLATAASAGAGGFLTGFLQSASSRKLFKLGGDIAAMSENHLRLVNWVTGLEKGMSPAEAAYYVNKALFDYSPAGQSWWSYQVMRRAFPFWTFKSKNLKYYLWLMVNRPEYLATLNKALLGLTHHDPSPETRAMLTPHLQSRVSIPMGDGAFVAGLGIPIEDAVESFRAMESGILKGVPGVAGTVGAMNPWLTSAAEGFFNQSFFFDRELTDLKRAKDVKYAPQIIQEFLGYDPDEEQVGKLRRSDEKWWRPTSDEDAAYRLHLLRRLDSGSVLRTMYRLRSEAYQDAVGEIEQGDLAVSPAERALNLLTGIRTYQYDMEQMNGQAAGRLLRALQDKLGGRYGTERKKTYLSSDPPQPIEATDEEVRALIEGSQQPRDAGEISLEELQRLLEAP